jgi:hypothetical protein
LFERGLPRRPEGCMHAHNLSALEQELTADGWIVYSHAYVDPGDIPGRVDRGGYDIVLTAPDGTTHRGRGPTRAAAMRTACDTAGLLPVGGPTLT